MAEPVGPLEVDDPPRAVGQLQLADQPGKPLLQAAGMVGLEPTLVPLGCEEQGRRPRWALAADRSPPPPAHTAAYTAQR